MLVMSIQQTQNVPIIIGSTSSFDVSIQNTSSTQDLYNLDVTLTLPDGMQLDSSSIPQTSSVNNANNSTTYSWINLKDLAPLEVDFKLTITVKCNTTFKNGTAVPFGYNFSGISVGARVDTLPRGIYDIGNQVITQQISMTYVTIRFSSKITTTGKVLKGAGTSTSVNDYTQVATATCNFTNNSLSASAVNIAILLDNGIRYIGNITVSGTDASKFVNPIVSLVTISGKTYTQLYYGNVNLSLNSNTSVTFSYAVWNRYDANIGGLIAHGTTLNMAINMTSANPLVIASSSSSTSFVAMDLIIDTSSSLSIVDVQSNVTYTYVYKVGQYYSIQGIIVHYFLPDGLSYLSSSITPTSAVDNPTLQGYYLTYNFASAAQNSTNTVTINAVVDSFYRYKTSSQGLNLPVVAADTFKSTTDITGTLVGLATQVTDNASVITTIDIANITKQFIQGYYKDGTPKTITALAPGDFAEYLLTYDASTLKAVQKQISIDDFFPLAADPINNLNYIYTGITPVNPAQLIDPHGVTVYYGDLPGLSSGTINFKIPIASLGSPPQNVNLMKLQGINTEGYAYSERSQIDVNIGTPNLVLTKSISGPTPNAIKVNQVYTYTVTISNTNTLGTETDAFNFTLNDTLSATWFTLNSGSINVTGTGSFNPATVQGNNIVVDINKLAPGQSITLAYSVTIISTLAPNVTITTTATNTNPYSQVYNPSSTNYQYTNLNKTASVTITSQSVTFAKTNWSGVFKVGSLVTYALTLTIPRGTIAYGVYVRDTLPIGEQTYVGPSYLNGTPVTPTVSSNIVTFPTITSIDARNEAQTLTYLFTAQISNATKTGTNTTSTQTNSSRLFVQQVPDGSYIFFTRNVTITVNHPNIVLTLSSIDKTTSTVYTSTANINTSSVMQFRLLFQNNSAVNITNGTIEIPIDNNFIFSAINTTTLCSATYNSTSKKVIVTIPQLNASSSGYVTFTVLPLSTLRSGTTINTQATAVSYYNDVTNTKLYGGETSNVISCILAAGVSLTPDPLHKLNNTTSFYVTAPGTNLVILDYFKNTGGGYDDFTLKIQPVALPYSLYIDDIKITDVAANTLYQSNLATMSNLAPNTAKVIKIECAIPSTQPLGIRHDFIVNAKSTTNPFPEQTVLNIDPNA